MLNVAKSSHVKKMCLAVLENGGKTESRENLVRLSCYSCTKRMIYWQNILGHLYSSYVFSNVKILEHSEIHR